MRVISFVLTILLVFAGQISAKKIIADLDFSQGRWAMIGVPLHNYKLLPIQEELSTFISKDISLMEEIQQEWDLDRTYENKCDYHYALKFYQDNKLVRTLNLNLYCGYITINGQSFAFEPTEFDRFKSHAKAVSWSRISFADLELLREAIYTLDKAEDVYWYEDVKQYIYPGFIVLSINGLPWNTDIDSLTQVVDRTVEQKAGTSEFYLQKYYHVIRGEKLFVKYLVNCNQWTASALEQYADYPWRSHLHNRDSVSILAIGIDRKRYWKLMRD